MNDIKLSLSQAGPSGELSIIRADGVVDTLTASELEGAIEGLVEQKRYKILVDLGGVEYISSAGWGIFISKIQEIRNREGDIKLVNMIPNVYEIYELLEFENIIQAFETLEQGKRAFNLPTSGDAAGEKVWKAQDGIRVEPGTKIQAAFSPGLKNRPNSAGGVMEAAIPPRTADEAVIRLVEEDPFSSIPELVRDAAELAPQLKLNWWTVFNILRRKRLLTHRARFRYARKKSRRMQ